MAETPNMLQCDHIDNFVSGIEEGAGNHIQVSCKLGLHNCVVVSGWIGQCRDNAVKQTRAVIELGGDLQTRLASLPGGVCDEVEARVLRIAQRLLDAGARPEAYHDKHPTALAQAIELLDNRPQTRSNLRVALAFLAQRLEFPGHLGHRSRTATLEGLVLEQEFDRGDVVDTGVSEDVLVRLLRRQAAALLADDDTELGLENDAAAVAQSSL